MSGTRAVATAKDSIAILRGHKAPMIMEIILEGNFNPKWYAKDMLGRVFDLDVEKVVKRGYLTKPELQKVWLHGSAETQGIVDPGTMPKWASANMARPLTLFQRMAYRSTMNLVKNVFRPLGKGNVGPLFRWAGAALLGGFGLYSAYALAFKQHQAWRDKKLLGKLWDLALRGEILGIISNLFQYGGLTEGYYPVIIRNTQEFLRHVWWVITGKEFPLEGVQNAARRAFAIYNHTLKAYEAYTDEEKTRYKQVRSQSYAYMEREGIRERRGMFDIPEKTVRSPYYAHIRAVFHAGKPEEWAQAYWGAYWFMRNESDWDQTKAEGILKGIVTRIKPIPMSDENRKTFLHQLKESDRKRAVTAMAEYDARRQWFFEAVESMRDSLGEEKPGRKTRKRRKRKQRSTRKSNGTIKFSELRNRKAG